MVAHNGHQGFQTAGLGVIRHRYAFTGFNLQKAQPVQLPQALVHHCFADLHFIGQFPFGGQMIAGPQLTGKNKTFQLLDKKFPQRGGGNLLERHGISSFSID